MCHEHGFKGIIAFNGDSALNAIESYNIAAILLDIRLPDMDGWSILDRIKRNIHHRHIPIQVISADNHWKKSRRLGALAHITKPTEIESLNNAFEKINRFIQRKVKMVLIIDPDEEHRETVIKLLSDDDLQMITVINGQDALKAVKELDVDCVILDIGLPDVSGLDVVSHLRQLGLRDLPIIIYTGFANSITQEKIAPELRRLETLEGVMEVATLERLFDESSIFLHRHSGKFSPSRLEMIKHICISDPLLAGCKVLVVDDDARNIYALKSALEQHNLIVIYADNARDGIKLIKATPDLDAVLMDIMMPDMDGYAGIRKIRMIEKYADLPIIAVTAKAMKGDREKCIEAGATDYMTKPVDLNQLLSLLRIAFRDSLDRKVVS
jgi:CheY-like chemotaxis protein